MLQELQVIALLDTINTIRKVALGRTPEKELLGLDMGTDSVKIVQLARRDGNLSIKRLLSESRPDSEREITENEAIKRIVNRSGIKTGNTITTIPSRDINEKFIMMHLSAAEKMEDILRWEVKKHINYPLQEAVYDYHLDPGGESDELSVHLAITKRELIENKVRSLGEAGFTLSVIETESRAIRRAVSANEKVEGIISGVVNLGSSSSTFVVMDNGELKFCRDMDVIGEDIDRTISKMLHIDMEASEVAKREIGLDRMVMDGQESEPTSVKYNVYSAIESQIDRLIAEINQSMHFYGIQSETDSRLDRLYVTGGNARIPNLIPFMRGKMDTEIKIFDPADYFEKMDGNGGEARDSLVQFTVAIGLAMRGME
ncbi:MAG: type IV pilus assembly protein PilM [Candidatus Latescibacteria bacterium]|nr:type IV pilus assembly protein PilM [bacterium]MBD3424214.1 type IV pilus assembly protein PilM [Candidatus Latescibacterota bacterium]